jgi:hypothetical protein
LTVNPFQILKAVRIILTRLRLDATTVLVQFDRGTLLISGRLQHIFSLEGRRSELNRELLHEMDRRIRRIDGVRQVGYALENWALNSDGHWSLKKTRR